MFLEIFAFFVKTTSYSKIFKIMFPKFSSQHWSKWREGWLAVNVVSDNTDNNNVAVQKSTHIVHLL